MYRFRELTPLDDGEVPITLGEGSTPLLPLPRLAAHLGLGRLWAKDEGQNPTGSLKDRMASAVIARAEQEGRLKPGDTVIEYTGGSTGASLAWVCAAKGYRIRIVSSDAFSPEKLDQMAAFGAEIILTPQGRYLVVNEQGKLQQLPPNPTATVVYGRDTIVGDVLVCDHGEID